MLLWVQRGTPILCPRTAFVKINFDIYREHSRQLTQGQDLASAGVSKPNPGVCCPGLSETPCVKSSNTNTSCPALPPSQHKVPFTLPPHHCCDDQCPHELVDNPRIFSKIANILAGIFFNKCSMCFFEAAALQCSLFKSMRNHLH